MYSSGGRKQHVCHPIALMARIGSCNASHTNTQGPADSHTVLTLPGPSFTQVDLGRLSVSPFSLHHGKTTPLKKSFDETNSPPNSTSVAATVS